MSSSFTSIDSLRESLAAPAARRGRTPEYAARMIHEVPDAEVVDRAAFLVERCKGKAILDVGASGAMSVLLREAAREYHGIDRPDRGKGISDVLGLDLDDYHAEIPRHEGVEVIVCGEVLEHLSNPGWLLDRLRATYPAGVTLVVTAPNAFSEGGRKHLEQEGVENVNLDHVAWYSWRTLLTLLERAGWRVTDFRWYKGRPYFAEGLIFVAV